MKNAKIVVLSGPSGVGKGTVSASLRRGTEDYDLSVSVTTRAPRVGEKEGVHYFYRTQDEFDRMIEDGSFAEYIRIYNNSYGTLKSELQRIVDSGKHVLLDIEFEGGLNIKKAFPDAVLIYLLPPSLAELKQRIEGRGSETPETLAVRYGKAVAELAYAEQYDYILVNNDVDECVDRINAIVSAEQMRSKDNLDLIESLKGGNRIC